MILKTKFENMVNENGNLVIVRVSNKNWKDFKEFYLVVCYKEDRESRFKTDSYFEKLKDYIIKLKMDNIIVIGVLNGRIGLLNDNEKKKQISPLAHYEEMIEILLFRYSCKKKKPF